MRDTNNCLPFVEHLRCEHRRLNGEVQGVLQAIQNWKQNQKSESAMAVAQHLERLRDELKHHFAEEEGEGCLEEAVVHRPSIAGEMKAVQQEHGTLKTDLDRLISQTAPTVNQTPNAELIEQEFIAFSKRLRIHEAAENHILRTGFGAEGMDSDADCGCEDFDNTARN